MEITFIGAGNVAWHLAPALENAGHHVNEVVSRQLSHARQLVSNTLYDARPRSDFNLAQSVSQLFILTVPDDALPDVCARLVLPEGAIVVHTSGTRSLGDLTQLMQVYSDVPVHTGVFYPLQTFSRQQSLLDFEEIPLCIEAADPETESQLVALGQEISSIVYLVDSAERRVLHLAAVFACNFTNHLFAIAKGLTDAHDLEFDLLKPLIRETFRKGMAAADPATVQTGPARRGDQKTIDTHLDMLRHQPRLQAIYDLLTASIRAGEKG
ncbi:DUF2520 domain-containing protein [Rudanella paleaurantiibacter]|uniref:DUF2520 domain-containing protein n=1 Tax=Rudanella paleaurantiibacter TaxID=2614655 RepID=A0A7J5TY28_9BACT|nr:Rossmann-like and DUF2520 domain-containing protein [Rudanella paleaurantiibacter]KAB7729333.1 DUF2520 domain-containing protein [Rudanella paleaurantiibacter]